MRHVPPSRLGSVAPIALVSILLSACSGDDTKSTASGVADGGVDGSSGSSAYPKDAVLHLNDVQVLATHNSYHLEKPNAIAAEWRYSHDPLDVQLQDQGVRGLEIDTHFEASTGTLRVYHIPSLDDQTSCDPFTECLGIVKTWSDAHPHHTTLFIQIEPKEASLNDTTVDFVRYADAFDEMVLSVFSEDQLVTPADVQGDAATLREAVLAHGFPTLGETRGKILFYINERAGFHDAYTRGGADITGRVAFPQSNADEPIAGVLIPNDPTNADNDTNAKSGFLERVMVDGVPPDLAKLDSDRAAALAGGAHVLSTDYPVSGDTGIAAFELTGGDPARCNPITAPADCTPHDIENPAALDAAP